MKLVTLLVFSFVIIDVYMITSAFEFTSQSLIEDVRTVSHKTSSVQISENGKDIQGALELTSKNFDISINDGNIWLIEFYAPWCSHCINFASTYDNLAMNLHGMHGMSERNITVAKVDGSSDRILASRFSVRGFPTFFLVDGWTVWEFEGSRSKENLLKFATENDKESEPISFLYSPFGPIGQLRSLLVHSGMKVLNTYDKMVDNGFSPAFAAIIIGSLGVIFGIIIILIVGISTLPKIKDE